VSNAVVDSAAAELYAGQPEEFTQRRKELATAARTAGDREAARLIGALRKPTRAAWVVNRLAHAEPGTPALLADLAAGLRAAEQSKDGPRLRELTSRRRALLDDLAGQALRLAGLADPPAGLREEVTATLAAALADDAVAASLATGTLVRSAAWSGFGLATELRPPAEEEAGAPDGASSTDDGSTAGDSRGMDDSAGGVLPAVPPPRVRAVPLPPQGPRTLPPGARPAAALSGALPPEGIGSGRGRRPDPADAIAAAERAVATAAEISAQATATEDRLEVRVRDLEQQLTKARAELADARRKARHAESAERNARTALTRARQP
jgi:hypothetical protein